MLKAALEGFATRIALVMIAALLALAGAGFLLAALYLALTEIASPPLAALLAGVIALVAAAIPVLVLRFRGRRGRQAAPSASGQERERDASEPAAMASALGAELGLWVDRNSRTAVAGALLAGVFLGASPKARSELRKLLKTAGAGRGSPNRQAR
jgi:divalent metal cation (Fe/Co/Zn/Cd) transporter